MCEGWSTLEAERPTLQRKPSSLCMCCISLLLPNGFFSSEIQQFGICERHRNGEQERDREERHQEKESRRVAERYRDTERQGRRKLSCLQRLPDVLCGDIWHTAVLPGCRWLMSQKPGISRLQFSADMWAILNKTVCTWYEGGENTHSPMSSHFHWDVPEHLRTAPSLLSPDHLPPSFSLPGPGDVWAAACPLRRLPTLPFHHVLQLCFQSACCFA